MSIMSRTNEHKRRLDITKIINFFAGPGAGKSSCAAQLFSLMKNESLNVELVTEFAKELTWHQSKALDCQPYVFGHQLVRLEVLLEKVDYIITDSPILLSCIYNSIPELTQLAIAKHQSMTNINILLNRKKPYNPVGRNESEIEAIEIDKSIRSFLNSNFINYIECNGQPEAIQNLFNSGKLL